MMALLERLANARAADMESIEASAWTAFGPKAALPAMDLLLKRGARPRS